MSAAPGRVPGELSLANAGLSTADYLAFDIMADVVFSAQYNTVENEKFRYVIGAIADHNVRLGVIAQAPELSIKALQRPMFLRSIKARDRFVKFIRILLGIRLKNKTKQRDIFSYIQDAEDPDTGKGLDFTELSTETATMIVAGMKFRILSLHFH